MQDAQDFTYQLLYIAFMLFFNYVDYSVQLLVIAVLLLIPAGIDGFTQFLDFRESNNTLRLLTGLCGGLGFIILVKAFKFYFF